MKRRLVIGRFRITLATPPKNIWKKDAGITVFGVTVFPNKPFKGVKLVLYPLSVTFAVFPKGFLYENF